MSGYPKDEIVWDYLSANSGKVLRRRYVNDLEEQDYADYFHWNDAQGTAKSELEVERGATGVRLCRERGGCHLICRDV